MFNNREYLLNGVISFCYFLLVISQLPQCDKESDEQLSILHDLARETLCLAKQVQWSQIKFALNLQIVVYGIRKI